MKKNRKHSAHPAAIDGLAGLFRPSAPKKASLAVSAGHPADDHVKLGFGRYSESTPLEVARENPAYLLWVYEHINPLVCSESLAARCRGAQQSRREALRHGR